jgi:hypothetical protein
MLDYVWGAEGHPRKLVGATDFDGLRVGDGLSLLERIVKYALATFLWRCHGSSWGRQRAKVVKYLRG